MSEKIGIRYAFENNALYIGSIEAHIFGENIFSLTCQVVSHTVYNIEYMRCLSLRISLT